LRRLPSGDLRRISAWFALFRAGAPQGALPYARVRLKSGDVYAGYIVYYSEDLPLTDRELVLGAPLVYRPAESNLRELDYRWQRIVVSGSDVEALWVSYIKPSLELRRILGVQALRWSRRCFVGGSWRHGPRCS
jgi:hypothetical protein